MAGILAVSIMSTDEIRQQIHKLYEQRDMYDGYTTGPMRVQLMNRITVRIKNLEQKLADRVAKNNG